MTGIYQRDRKSLWLAGADHGEDLCSKCARVPSPLAANALEKTVSLEMEVPGSTTMWGVFVGM